MANVLNLASIPLFPLPQVVLFPGMSLPLHVFEPRYRRMTADALAGDRLLSVVHIPDPGDVDEHGQPALAPVAGIGRIEQHERMSDGRYNILVVGQERGRLFELPFDPPYRRARFELLESSGDAETATLIMTASRFVAGLRNTGRDVRLQLPPTSGAGQLADVCAELLILDGCQRQRVLETLDVAERIQLCTEIIATQHALLTRGAVAAN